MRARLHVLRLICTATACSAVLLASAARAHDGWNPFADKDNAPRTRRADQAPVRQGPDTAAPAGDVAVPGGASYEPIQRGSLPPLDEAARAVERGDLPLPLASDGSGLPNDVWHGLDAKGVSELVLGLGMPPSSAPLAAIWKRLWTASSAAGGGPAGGRIEAVYREVLFRSGLLDALSQRIAQSSRDVAPEPVIEALDIRFEILAGDRDRGCELAKQRARTAGDLPKPVRAELLLLGGYCAALQGNPAAAALASELARAEGAAEPFAPDVLDALGSGGRVNIGSLKQLSLMDYRFLEAAKVPIDAAALDQAEPALLVVIATGHNAAEGTPPQLVVRAAERAARLNAMDGAQLAAVYRALPVNPADGSDATTARGETSFHRAALFKAIEAERTPMKKARLARALLDDARRAGLGRPVAEMLARSMESLAPAQEIGWFAETAVEINLAAGRYSAAAAWITFAETGGGPSLNYWWALLDLADPAWRGHRGESLPVVERMALRGQLSTGLMHRLVTVLDALDYQIPIPLWEAASRTPQPTTGFLPETGVLSQLQDAARQQQFARTVLLVARTLGPHGADGAHLAALTDSIRALRRAGLEGDARRLALEAVLGDWPRMAGN
jgi:hypothetical protein